MQTPKSVRYLASSLRLGALLSPCGSRECLLHLSFDTQASGDSQQATQPG